jgi:hypothetical protein
MPAGGCGRHGPVRLAAPMIRALRTIRTVMLVAIALVVLAAVDLFGWWTAIAPDCRSIWGHPGAGCIAADCRGLTVVLDAPLHHRRPLNRLGGRPEAAPVQVGPSRMSAASANFPAVAPQELGGGPLDLPVGIAAGMATSSSSGVRLVKSERGC